MSEELALVMPILVEPAETVQALADEVPGPPHGVPTPDPEQARAAEAVFAAHERESEAVQGMLGIYMGAMLLNDLAHEHFGRPAGRVEDEEQEDRS